MAKDRRKARKKRKRTEDGLKRFFVVFIVILIAAAAVIFVNERWIHCEYIPTTSQIFRVIGLQKKPDVHVEQDEISVHFIDVGQGDCIFIDTPDKDMLIDCGEAEYSGKVIQYLLSFGVTKLDYVMVTHQHSDHMGGMSRIMTAFDVGELIMPEIPAEMTPEHDYYVNALDVAGLKSIPVVYSELGRVIELSEGTALSIIGPLGTGYEDLNSYSIVSKLQSGNISFLLTGDMEKDAELELTASLTDLQADVVKVPHHGSSTSSSSAFVKRVKPQYTVISVGIDNDYGHPANEVLGRYYAIKSKVLMTMFCGDIVFVTDGNELTYVTTNDDTSAA